MPCHSTFRCWWILLAIGIVACGGGEGEPDGGEASPYQESLSLSVVGTLPIATDGKDLIARPTSVYQLPDGRLVIGDKSERNIKIVAAGLDSVGVISRAGNGPGEFSTLLSVGVLADSIVALQGGGAPEVRVYSTDGVLHRSFSVMLWGPRDLSVVDDSLFLLTRYPIFRQGQPIVSLLDRSGTTRAAFFPLDYYLPESAIELAQYTNPFADGRDGLVWVSFSGSDSVFAFDYHGTRLGSVAIPGDDGPIPTYRSAFDETGGRFQRADSTWSLDGLPTASTLVALPGGQALLEVLRFDAKQGFDRLLDRGTIHLLHLRPDGSIEVKDSRAFDAGLFGRDNKGRPLLLHLVDSGATDAIELTRLFQ